MGILSAPNGRSGELSYVSSIFIRADQKIRPLRDHIIVEPLPVDHASVLQVFEGGKPVRGIVKAVGPGHYPKIYDHPDKHRRTRMRDSKYFLPTEVKIGDIVELGSPQGMRGYNFPQIVWGNKIHIICREADVSGIVI